MGLPGPFYILRCVVVSMQAHAALWTGMPADGQAFRDHCATARTPLPGIGRRPSDYPLPSVCCFESEFAQELRPARVGDGLRETVILKQIGRLHVLMRDRVIGAH